MTNNELIQEHLHRLDIEYRNAIKPMQLEICKIIETAFPAITMNLQTGETTRTYSKEVNDTIALWQSKIYEITNVYQQRINDYLIFRPVDKEELEQDRMNKYVISYLAKSSS